MDSLCILFLTNAHNSMSQKAYLELTELGHKVHVELAHSAEHMIHAFKKVQPDAVVCPFLTKRVPEEIWKNIPTLIVHPGIKGDRGASSLDYALRENEEEWGVTILQAVEEMDAGDIYSSVNFSLEREDENTLTKSSLYKNEVINAAILGLKNAILMIQKGIKPEPLNYNNKDVKGKLRQTLKLSERKINWEDSADIIAREVRAADGRPGILSSISDIPLFLHGSHVELYLNQDKEYAPGTLIAKRNEAVCVACGNGTAIWFAALRLKNEGASQYFKLPALDVFPKEITQKLKESEISLEGAPKGTFKEIWTETIGDICYLHFNFHNGAMHTRQCKRLAKIITEIGNNDKINVIVLMGGHDYFSNGIHLNVIQAAEDPALESWENINAINDIILSVFNIKNKITVSAFQGNAGAGGVMMALCCDFVFMGSHVVLNPHYKSMFLFGSEYWTYSLPKRVGPQKALELTEGMQPLSANEAKRIGLVDDVFGSNFKEFSALLKEKVKNEIGNENTVKRIVSKKMEERNSKFFEAIQKAREFELSKMKVNFQDPNYIQGRRRFVMKESCGCTPVHFPKIVNGISCTKNIIKKNEINNNYDNNNMKIISSISLEMEWKRVAMDNNNSRVE